MLLLGLETFWTLLFQHGSTIKIPWRLSQSKQPLKAWKRALNKECIEHYKMTCFVIEQVRNHQETNDETSVSERLKRSEMLFQMLVSMPKTTFETAIFLVQLIFYKINSLQKEAIKKDLSLSRDCLETLCHFKHKTFQSWNVLFQLETFCFKPDTVWT